jgi:hypothetical protein
MLMGWCIEGDVEGIMEKPTVRDEPSRRAREKWYKTSTHALLFSMSDAIAIGKHGMRSLGCPEPKQNAAT